MFNNQPSGTKSKLGGKKERKKGKNTENLPSAIMLILWTWPMLSYQRDFFENNVREKHAQMGLMSKQGSAPAHQCTQIILLLLNSFQSYLIYHQYLFFRLPWQLSGKESSCLYRRHRFNPLVGKMAWRRKWQPSPVFLPGKSYGQRSLVGYSPWVPKQSDMTQPLNNKKICVLPALSLFLSFPLIVSQGN